MRQKINQHYDYIFVNETKIIPYRNAFPVVTSMTKGMIGVLRTPATKVMGSPIIGTHENNKDHLPYLLKYSDALSIWASENGNQRLSLYVARRPPNHQFTAEPTTLPAVAAKNKMKGTPTSFAISDASVTSDNAGNNVAAMKAFQNRAKYTAKSASTVGFYGHLASGGSDINIASTLPPVLRPKVVPRS